MDVCGRCGERAVLFDHTIDQRICTSCGVEYRTDVFENQLFTADGRANFDLIRSVDVSQYHDLKIYRANDLISDITSRLNLSAARAFDVTRMIVKITDGKFGMGEWFTVLIAASSYVVMRQNSIPLSIAEAAGAIGRDVHEVGRMVKRILDYFDIGQLPEFDTWQSLEQAIGTSSCLSGAPKEKAEEMVRQGKFLMQCAVKWFLTTGRQPLPLVAAVISFLSDVNGVSVSVEEVANEVYASVATSKLRKKELLKTLVNAAKVLLPWGEDVNVKNIVHNAPLLLRYMEIISKKDDSFDFGTFRVDLENDGMYMKPEAKDSVYFNAGNGENMQLGNQKLSGVCLSSAYGKALDGCNLVRSSNEFGKHSEKRRKRNGIDIDAQMSCGSSSTSEPPSLKLVLERDVGYSPPPPSFVSGLVARKKRKERMEAARIRIAQIVKPKSEMEMKNAVKTLEKPKGGGNRRREKGVDWEDCIIEKLLLYRVSEEEILQGHYSRLMDLHVFNSLDAQNSKLKGVL